MYRLKTYATYGLNERNVSCCMFPIYNNVTRGFLIICVCVCVCVCVCACISFFLFLLLLFFFLLFFFFSLSYYLFKPSNYIITNIVTIVFINITVLGVLEKSSWGEFQARNSSGMVYPYSQC